MAASRPVARARWAAGFLALTAACHAAPAPRATTAPPAPSSAVPLLPIEQDPPLNQMRSALRALTAAQNQYYARHQTFTDDVAALRQMPACSISRFVEVAVVAQTPHGFALRSRHPALPGRSCVQWVSRPGAVPVPVTDHEQRRGDVEPGAVVCDTAS